MVVAKKKARDGYATLLPYLSWGKDVGELYFVTIRSVLPAKFASTLDRKVAIATKQ